MSQELIGSFVKNGSFDASGLASALLSAGITCKVENGYVTADEWSVTFEPAAVQGQPEVVFNEQPLHNKDSHYAIPAETTMEQLGELICQGIMPNGAIKFKPGHMLCEWLSEVIPGVVTQKNEADQTRISFGEVYLLVSDGIWFLGGFDREEKIDPPTSVEDIKSLLDETVEEVA